MKKLILTVLAALLLMTAAAGYSIENSEEPFPGNPIYTEEVNNDPAVQAQMLYELGLFKGRDEGNFALDSTMTREEAAVMLIRFLGDEAKALEQKLTHPFTDVADWADPYVGWLYQKGYTKGMGGSKYGGSLDVTYWQFGKFLARATRDARFVDLPEDDENIATEEELAQYGTLPIPRAHAVSLSVRALFETYTRDTTYGYHTTAWWLWHHGVFTVEQLMAATENVCDYGIREETGEDGLQYLVLSCVGVDAGRSEISGIRFAGSAGGDRGYIYATGQQTDGSLTFYTMDRRTLEVLTTQKVEVDAPHEMFLLHSTAERDYFEAGFWPEDGSSRQQYGVYVWDGTELSLATSKEELWKGRKETGIWEEHMLTQNDLAWSPEEGLKLENLPLVGADTLFTLTSGGVTKTPVPEGAYIITWDGRTAVFGSRNAQQMRLSCMDLTTGQMVEEYSVAQDIDSEFDWRTVRLSSTKPGILYGTAGLYEYKDGRLTQITERPAVSVGSCQRDGQTVTVIVSHELGKRYYSPMGYAGNQLCTIAPDGTITVEYEVPSELGHPAESVSNNDGPEIVFSTAIDEGMMHIRYTTYRVEDTAQGKLLRVIGYVPGRAEMMVGTVQDNIRKEQDRLYGLGLAEAPGQEPVLETETATVFQRVLESETVLTCRAEGSSESDIYRVAAGKTVTGQYDYTIYGETVHYLYGTAGLYKLQKGRLLQMTQMPVLQMEFFRDGPSYAMALVSRDENGNDALYTAWDWGDGVLDKLTLRYTCLPEHGLEITALPKHTESLQFTCTVSHGIYTYLVLGTAEAPNIWTIGYEAKDPMTKTWSEYLWEEIDRLHALGISDPGPLAEDRGNLLAETAKEGT